MDAASQAGGIDRTVRERLLRAATELFARTGYAATTVREIVDTAGVTKPVLYYHFGSKEGIYLALMSEAQAVFERALDEAVARGGSAREQLSRVLGDVLELISANLDVVRVVHSIFYGPPQGAPFVDFDAFHQRLVATLRGVIERGIVAGELRAGDVESITWAVLGAFHVGEGVCLLHPELCFDRARLERVLDVIFRGVLNENARERLQ